jgi:hypothetical protein
MVRVAQSRVPRAVLRVELRDHLRRTVWRALVSTRARRIVKLNMESRKLDSQTREVNRTKNVRRREVEPIDQSQIQVYMSEYLKIKSYSTKLI